MDWARHQSCPQKDMQHMLNTLGNDSPSASPKGLTSRYLSNCTGDKGKNTQIFVGHKVWIDIDTWDPKYLV